MSHKHNPLNDEEAGEIICKDCGIVLEENLLSTKTNTIPDDNGLQNTSRGPPNSATIHDRSLASVINKDNVDYNNKRIPSKTAQQMSGLRLQDERTKYHIDKHRGIRIGLQYFSRLRSKLNIPMNIYEICAKDFRQQMSKKKDFARGRVLQHIVVGSLYLTLRDVGAPKTLSELSQLTAIPRKQLARSVRYLIQQNGYQSKAPGPEFFINRACNDLQTSEKVKRDALELLRLSKGNIGLTGKKPNGIAAAAIYHSATTINKQNLSQAHIADVLQVTEVSVRNIKKLKFWEDPICKLIQ